MVLLPEGFFQYPDIGYSRVAVPPWLAAYDPPQQTGGPDDRPPPLTPVVPPTRLPYGDLECSTYTECTETQSHPKIEPVANCLYYNYGLSSTGVSSNPCVPGGSGGNWSSGDGMGSSAAEIVQPYAVSWLLRFPQSYAVSPPGAAPKYVFECSVRWSGPAPASDLATMNWYGPCRVGNGQLVELGFLMESVRCEEGLLDPDPVRPPTCVQGDPDESCDPGCDPNDARAWAYRLLPVGDYHVEFLVDGVVEAERRFKVTEFDDPDPWPFEQPDERPIDGTNRGAGPVYLRPADYDNPGPMTVWPNVIYCHNLGDCTTSLPLPYGPNIDCEGTFCTTAHPWDLPLPWGSPNGQYNIRPRWGDYIAAIPQPRSAPYPPVHVGFDFIYPQCPRQDWCYNEDPCEVDSKDCIPTWCEENPAPD